MKDGEEDYILVSRSTVAGALGAFLVVWGAVVLMVALGLSR